MSGECFSPDLGMVFFFFFFLTPFRHLARRVELDPCEGIFLFGPRHDFFFPNSFQTFSPKGGVGFMSARYLSPDLGMIFFGFYLGGREEFYYSQLRGPKQLIRLRRTLESPKSGLGKRRRKSQSRLMV